MLELYVVALFITDANIVVCDCSVEISLCVITSTSLSCIGVVG